MCAFCFTREPVQDVLIAHDREHPRLFIDRARGLHRGADQAPDRLIVDSLWPIFTHRAPAGDRLAEFHFIISAC